MLTQASGGASPGVQAGDSRLPSWRRAYGPVSEAAETQDALIGVTGGNPRKGFCKTSEDMLAEAGDTVASALLFIQSQVKDADITWAYFRRALAKVAGRAAEAGYPS